MLVLRGRFSCRDRDDVLHKDPKGTVVYLMCSLDGETAMPVVYLNYLFYGEPEVIYLMANLYGEPVVTVV